MHRNKRQKKKYSLKRYVTAAGLIVFIAFFAGPVWGVYEKERAVRAEERETRKELETLLARKAFLEAEVERLKSERGIEEEVRTKFPVSKPGEDVIVIVDEEAAATSSVSASGGFWNRVRAFFE